MRVLVIVKATPDSEAADHVPDPPMLAAMGRYNDELRKAGVLLAAEGLKPSLHGRRVHFSGDRRTVTQGPFSHATELVAGFWLWQVRSIEEAVEWVRRCPNPMPTDSDIEIRPLFEAEDLTALLDTKDSGEEGSP